MRSHDSNHQLPAGRAALALSILFLLGGCASAHFVATGTPQTSREDDCAIEVFSSRVPDRAYEELGVLEGEGSLGADSLEKILPKMKREACRAGGDAIILLGHQKLSHSDDHFATDDELHVTATVVRWTS